MNTVTYKKRFKRILSIILSIVFSVTLLNCVTVTALQFPCYGVITGDGVRVRDNAGTSGSIITSLNKGNSVKIIASKNDSTGTLWYKVCYDLKDLSKEGFVSSAYVEISDMGDFETYLTKQGFPESYKEKLRLLHAAYPKWIFKADKINIDFNTVWENERVNGRSLVSGSAYDSWKSMYGGAYDWTNKKYVVYDSGGWVNASYRVIAYYLDPRNLLDASSVFQFSTHSYDESQTVENVKKMVKGTFLDADFTESTRYDTYSDLLVYAAKQSGVSPYVLASMILTEQGTNGIGSSISGKVSGYEGYYNYFNIGAYKTSTMTAVQRGLWWAKGAGVNATSYKRPWNTRAKSLVGGALWYADNYVTNGQNTLYYKKFNVVNTQSGLYSHQYMTNIQGATTEGKYLSKAYQNLKNSELTFNIPVYNNMPDNPYQLPTTTGANNFFLGSLKVAGYSITPTFNKYTYSYSVIVPNNVSSVSVTATGVQSTTTVSGTGTKSLAVGTNTFSIKAKGASGYSKTYTLKIIREQGPAEPPSLTSSTYKIGTYIKGVAPNTTVDKFKKGFTVTNGEIAVTTSNGKVKDSGEVGTGDILKLTSGGKTVKSYSVVILGDVNGDGSISLIDLAKIQKHILGVSVVSGAMYEAADISKDTKVNILDLAKVQKHLLGITLITQ